MGNSCITAKSVKQKNFRGDSVPEGTEDLRGSALSSLEFELELSNIQLRQPPPGLVGLRVRMQELLDWKYNKIQDSNVLTWKQKRKYTLKATEYQLRKMFINFIVVNGSDEQMGSLSLNLFLVLTGPWRHDFMIQYKTGKVGRLSGDIRCTQTIGLEMKTTKVQVNFLNQHPGEMFHFTLKTEDLVGNSEMTSESYDVETFLYNKKRSYQVDSQGESATYKKRKSMILEHQKGLQWSQSISQRSYQKQLPGFAIPLKVDSISNYSFHFILWKKSEQDDETFESYGETNIPMAKLFWTDVKGVNLNPEVGATREIEIREPVEFMGKKCGVMVIRVKVTTPKFFQQVLVLTRTELGMTQSRREVLVDKVGQCQNLKKMRGIKESMLNHMLKSGNLKNQHSEKGMKEYREHKNNIYQDILRFERLFLQGNGVAPLFEYGCDQGLLKAQNQMIDIIEKIIPLTDLRQVCISEAVWRCLRTMIFRGQFLLSKIGFTEQEIASINKESRSKMKKFTQERIALCQNYQAILVKLLILGLGKFGRKLLDQELKFVAAISTVCYFKIPEFRQQLLGSILNIHDNSERTYCYQNSYRKQNFLKFIDWQNKFSAPLAKYKTNKTILEQIKSNQKWKHVVGKRSTYFFVMIEDWATNLKAVLGCPDTIKCWSIIPGYNILIGSFLREMEIREVERYPDLMKDANMSLLSNECLLPIFMKILLEKTNTYEICSTLKCLQLISAYFAHFQYNKQILPSCFDTKLFYVAIKGILVSKNCFSISKLLQILYMYFNVFSNQFKKQISFLFLGRFFFTMMLNWGRTVRMMFKYLVIYRILVWAQDKQIHEISQRWDDLKIVFVEHEMGLVRLKQEQRELKGQNYQERMRYKLGLKKAQHLEEIVFDRRIKSEGCTNLKTEESATGTTQIATSPLGVDEYSHYFEKSFRKGKVSEEIDLKSVDQRRSSAPTPKKGVRNRRVSFFTDFEISSITFEEEPYLEVHKKEMGEFQEDFRVWRKTARSSDEIPRVEMRVPIDEGDIRPDNLDM